MEMFVSRSWGSDALLPSSSLLSHCARKNYPQKEINQIQFSFSTRFFTSFQAIMATSSSPEFEFWMVRNPPFPPPKLSTADELFVDGVILPLHLLNITPDPLVPHQLQSDSKSDSKSDADPNVTSPVSVSVSASPPTTAAKRWKDIIRGMKVEKKKGNGAGDGKLQRRNRKNSGGAAPELNINIWPFSFSRSRSAGNATTGSGSFPYKMLVVGRKVSSAPCSRSNSRGESSSSSMPKVPGNKSVRYPLPRIAGVGGVHVGRVNTIWQVRRGCKKNTDAKKISTTATATKKKKKKKKKKEEDEDEGEEENGEAAINADGYGGGAKRVSGHSGVGIRVLSLNVNTCIGNRLQSSCSGEEDDCNSKLTLTDGNQIPNRVGSSHFNLKAFFTKKVY